MTNPIALASLLFLAAFSAAACTTAQPAPLNTVTMDIKGKPFTMEIADTTPAQETGLMNRTSLPPDHGMVFVFPAAGDYPIWMKNTLINLDVVWINHTGRVLYIATMKAKDLTQQHSTQPAQYIIELSAGTARDIGLQRDDTINIPLKILQPHE